MRTEKIEDCIGRSALAGPPGKKFAEEARAELAALKEENERLREACAKAAKGYEYLAVGGIDECNGISPTTRAKELYEILAAVQFTE